MKLKHIFEKIDARQIINSRGNGAVEIDLITTIGLFRSSVPSGASTGKKEAVELVDKTVLKGVNKALFNIKNIIEPAIADSNIKLTHQDEFDIMLNSLDGSVNKARLGANAILPVSMAFCRAGAASKSIPLREHLSNISQNIQRIPRPFFNVINGGMHSGNKLKFQEIMVSFKFATFKENYEEGARFYQQLKSVISEKYGAIATNVGDEGGFAPPISTLEEGLDIIMETFNLHGFSNMEIAIDAAASSFYSEGMYDLGEIQLSSSEFIEYYDTLLINYPLIAMLEDPLEETDYKSWQKLFKRVNGRVRIVGDDLTVTNVEMIERAINMNLCDTLLVKLNQIGTVSQTMDAIKISRAAGMKIMISHRSGETMDTFISDFSVGVGAEYIKAGAPCRGERVEKYNQLLRIESAMNE